MRSYLKEIIFLLGKDKKRTPYLLILFFSVSIFDVIGISIIGPYVALVLDPTVSQGWLGNIIILLGLPQQQSDLLIILGLILIAIFFIKTILAVLVHRNIVSFSQNKMADLRSKLMQTYQIMPYSEYVQRNSSEYIYNIQTLTGQYNAQVLQPVLYIVSNGILSLALLILLAWQDILALALFAILLSTVIFGYDRLLRSKIKKYGKEVNIASTTLVKAVQEGMEGLKEIRILNKENFFYQLVDINAKKYAKYNTYSQVAGIVPRYLLELTIVIFVVLLIIITISKGGTMEAMFPTLVMFGVAAIRLLPAASILSSSLINLRYKRDAVSRLYKDLKIHQQITTDSQLLTKFYSPADIQFTPFNRLELKKISFKYSKEVEKSLDNISMTIKSGDSIGLIGTSGSGKTTLVDLMLGLLDSQEGTIKYNEKSFEKSLQEWRSQIAYLPQDVFIIDSTIKRNIALGVNDEKIDEERVDLALKQSHLLEFVNQLPQGKETSLGERGVRLSGGQRQRIALARAFYHGRNVLVMDESTSALDNDTEREVVAEVGRLKGEITMIVIAHRLSTLQHCDRIYELKQGRIVNSGTYQEILEDLLEKNRTK
ncbi:ABC transporter ATP-binding protein [Candidatus Pseudothioglobus sp. Uisw_041]|jgi:ABC-type multidrug transport system fused ATPase/permease subunit|uniref:ABC transporter ATP-binding protein n=1 Tax=Candidatus Pseudothioglobus sp. Uisw_041 TaxID=3230996 RepID=UPI003A86A08C